MRNNLTFTKICSVIFNKRKLIGALNRRGFFKIMKDEAFLRMIYKANFNYELNLENPETFNQKLQWLKLYDRKPIYTTMVDKVAVKEFVANKIGKEYIIPTLGIWDKFEDIDFDTLPNQFVLKCTHDSGGLIICKDKRILDINTVRKKINRCLSRNYFFQNREWPYKDVKPRILAEQYMEDSNSADSLNVYKIMTFNGEPKIIQTIQNDKKENETIDYFDCKWNLLELRQNFPNSDKPLNKPKNLEKMLELAKKMCKGFAFLRVDFYEVNGNLYFSEYTFFSDSGLAKFTPDKWDRMLGEWIVLPKNNS